jgi:hypothetical protein
MVVTMVDEDVPYMQYNDMSKPARVAITMKNAFAVCAPGGSRPSGLVYGTCCSEEK